MFPWWVGVVKLAVCIVITVTQRYRVSYMNVYVLLNLNELGKRDKMLGLPSILSLFRNKLNELKKNAYV